MGAPSLEACDLSIETGTLVQLRIFAHFTSAAAARSDSAYQRDSANTRQHTRVVDEWQQLQTASVSVLLR